jgi:hypothetical protein
MHGKVGNKIVTFGALTAKTKEINLFSSKYSAWKQL